VKLCAIIVQLIYYGYRQLESMMENCHICIRRTGTTTLWYSHSGVAPRTRNCASSV